jgi:tRNA(fMet)-specific endonuclease VapC
VNPAQDSRVVLMLDTNIISDMAKHIDGRCSQKAQHTLTMNPRLRLAVSTIVDCEVRFGFARNRSSKLFAAYEALLEWIEILPLDAAVSPHYSRIRVLLESAGKPIGANDTLIAAHALALDATLISGDAEFARVPGLKLENWLQPL